MIRLNAKIDWYNNPSPDPEKGLPPTQLSLIIDLDKRSVIATIEGEEYDNDNADWLDDYIESYGDDYDTIEELIEADYEQVIRDYLDTRTIPDPDYFIDDYDPDIEVERDYAYERDTKIQDLLD